MGTFFVCISGCFSSTICYSGIVAYYISLIIVLTFSGEIDIDCIPLAAAVFLPGEELLLFLSYFSVFSSIICSRNSAEGA